MRATVHAAVGSTHMWLATARDLQWRMRRFVIAMVGSGLVFAMTLVLAGLSASLHNEARGIVREINADAWVVRDGAYGPFTSISAMPASFATTVARTPGVQRADPLLLFRQTAAHKGKDVDVNVVGYRLKALGEPQHVRGALPARSGEAVVDVRLHRHIGDAFTMSGHAFKVVGTVHGLTVYGGQPVVFVALRDAQNLLLAGADVATVIVTRGVPQSAPPGFVIRPPKQVRADLLRPLGQAGKSIDLISQMLWVVAALIIGSVVYLSALERMRDFAVYKATGWASGTLMAGLAVQAVVLAGLAAVLGAVLAVLLAPSFPIPVTVPAAAIEALPAIAITVGLLASLAGLRRAVGADPAMAFGSA